MQNIRRRRPGGRRYFPRRKVCYFSAEKKTPDYKDVPVLRRFVSEWGKIESSRRTGTRARHQRKLAVAIKRARYLALLPYSGGHSLIELTRPDRGPRRMGPRDGGPGRFGARPAVEAATDAGAPAVAPAAVAPAAVASAAEGDTSANAPEASAPVAEPDAPAADESVAEADSTAGVPAADEPVAEADSTADVSAADEPAAETDSTAEAAAGPADSEE